MDNQFLCRGKSEIMFLIGKKKYFILFFALVLGWFNQSFNAQCNADAGPNVVRCVGSGVTLDGSNSSVPSGTISYSWTPVTGLSCTNCPSPTCTVGTNTTYTLEITNGAGCTNTDQVTVTVANPPTAAFTYTQTNDCANFPVSFNNTSTGAGLTYQWNFANPASGSNNTSNQQNPTHEFISEGAGSQNFNVQLIVTASNGCQATVSQNISIDQTPGPVLLDPFTSMKNCDGSNFNITVFNNSVSANNSNYQIVWGDGTADFNSATFPGGGTTHSYTANDIFDALFIVTGNNGCIDTSTYTVANITNPAIGAANPGGTNGCGPLNLCFPLNNFASNHSTTYYVVDYGDNSPLDTLPHPPPNQICHTYTQSSCGLAGNSYTFSIKAINLCDSSEATISPIRVYNAPEADFDPSPVPGCVGTAITMTNNSIAGFNSSCQQTTVVNWDFGDGTTLTEFAIQNTTHVYNTAGTYTVELSTQNGCGTSTDTKIICIEEPPVPNFTITPDTACVPFIAAINNLSDETNTCDVTYQWQVIFNGSTCLPSAGVFNFANGTTATDEEPEIEFVDPGEYIVRLTLTNSCGTFTFDRNVLAKSIPQATINPVGPICEGQSITPIVNLIHCYDSVDVFNWSFVGGNPASSNQEVPGNVSYANAGNYDVEITVSNACGNATANTPLEVNAAPTGIVPTVNSPLCEGQDAQFDAPLIANGTYNWTGVNGFTSSIQNPEIIGVTVADSGWYYLSPQSGGCPGPIDSVLLEIIEAPIITITSATTSICENDTISLTASGADTYTWDPATDLSATTGATVDAFPSTTITYTVTGTIGGCNANEDITIIVNTLPIVDGGGDLTLCNQPIAETLIGNPVGGVWSGDGGITAAGDFMPSTNGTFEVYYTFTDGNGCPNEDTVLITVNDPVPVTAPNDISICINSGIVTFVGLPAGGTWSGTNVTPIGDFNPISDGTFTLTYSLGAGSCETTDEVEVTVNPLPTVSAGQDQAVCIDNGIISLNGTPVGGTWSGTSVTLGGDFDPENAGAGAHILTYTYEDPTTGCDNSDDVTITVNDLPIVNAGNDTTLCNQPIASTLQGLPAGGLWSGIGITNPSGDFTPSSVGTFTVYFEFTDVNSCYNIDSIDITVVDPTNANAGLDSTICVDANPVQFTGIPAGGSWSGTGVSATGLFTPTVSGSFILTYIFGVGSCLTTDDLEVVVNDLPIVDAGADLEFCIDALPQNLEGNPLGGTWSGTGITDVSGEFTPSVAGQGAHIITYTYEDPITGCENTDDLEIVVNELPIVDAGNDTTVCNQPFPVQFFGTPAGGVWSGANVIADGTFTPNGIGNFTITYTFTLGTGCENSDDRTITVIDPVQSDAGIDREICVNEPDFQLAGVPVGGTWSGMNVTASGLFSPIQSGVFELEYIFGVGNCETRDTMYFTVHDLPIVTVGNDEDFCLSDDAFDFTGNPANGVWTGNGITDAILGTFDPGVATVGVHELVYTFTDPITTCINRDTLVAEVHPLPTPSFNFNPIMCIGTAEDLTNTSTLGVDFNWDFGDGATSNTENPQHTYSNIGFYDIQLIVTTAFGCIDSITSQVEVREPPIASFALAPDSGCAPLQVAFTNNSSGILVNYDWDFGNGTISQDEDPNDAVYLASVIADTIYYITLDVSNFCGTVTAIDSVQVMPEPTSVFGPAFDIGCSPWPLEFANNSLGLPDTYFWDFGDGTTSTSGDSLFVHTFTTGVTDTTYTIMLAVENECGQDTSYHTVTVLPNQVNAFYNTNITSGCEPLEVNFTQFSSGSTFYSWDFGDGNTSTVYSPTHTFTNAGTYTVSLFVNDGCSYDTTTVDITVFPSPFVDFNSTPDSVCANEPFIFNNLSVGLANSNWDFGDGNTSGLNNPTHSYSSTGVYQVSLTGESLTNGCLTTVSHPVTVSLQPIADFTAIPLSGCVPLDVDFTNLSVSNTFNSWNFGDGNTSNQLSPSHTFSQPGNYVVKLLVENANGCKDSVSQVITVYPLPVADFSIASTDACYAPVLITTSNTTTGAIGYEWNFGNGVTSTLNNPSNVYQNSGTYNISLIATSIHGCKDTSEMEFTVYPLPEAAFILPSDTACVGEVLIFESIGNFADSVVWSFGDGNIVSGDSVGYVYSNVGTFSVTIMAYGAGGCGDTLTLNSAIVVHPTPEADFDYINLQNPDPLSGTVEFDNLSTGALTYYWEFGNGENSTDENPTHRYRQIGDFITTLYSTNEFGCTDSITKTVFVEYFKGLHVPNALYPGHPSYEVSHFLPKGVGLYNYHIWIYDAWGNLIWESEALDDDGRPIEAWDGTFDGKPMPQDAYVWKVEAIFTDQTAWQGKEYQNGIYRSAGTVTLIR